ncbi:MAG: hypothetical protein IJ158_14710 [Treponema sp.]|nr:hypothetical protein [Treponema sp.]
MDIFEADDNSTPLTAEEKDSLKLKWITLRSELNEVEVRSAYIAALRKADAGDYSALMEFTQKK